jgi:hypothetical protein
MKYLLLGALILFSNLLKPQNSDILKFDLVHKTLDTLHIANGDTHNNFGINTILYRQLRSVILQS